MAELTIFAGHYGSGKTTAAVNYALLRRREQPEAAIALCDLDIVNPYFRSADFADILTQHRIELLSSSYANTNVEAVWLPTNMDRIFDDPGLVSIIDLGGDDCGAMALGRYAERLRGRSDVRLWLVVNPYRPMTRDLAGLWEIRREMEAAAGLPFGGIVNCANLAGETTAETIAQSFGLLRALSQKMALPIVLTAVPAGLPLRLPPDMAGTRLEIQTRKTPGS